MRSTHPWQRVTRMLRRGGGSCGSHPPLSSVSAARGCCFLLCQMCACMFSAFAWGNADMH